MRTVLQLVARFRRVDYGRWHGQTAPGTVAMRQRDDGERVAFLQAVVTLGDFGGQPGADFGDGFLQLDERHPGVGSLLLFHGKSKVLQLDQLIQNIIHCGTGFSDDHDSL